MGGIPRESGGLVSPSKTTLTENSIKSLALQEGGRLSRREHIWNMNDRSDSTPGCQRISEEKIVEVDHPILEGVEADVFIYGRDRSGKLDPEAMSKFSMNNLKVFELPTNEPENTEEQLSNTDA